MATMRNRFATVLAATAVTVGVSFGTGAGTAAAAPRLTYSESWYQDGQSLIVFLYKDGDYAGFVNWNADPDSFGTPGDALRAHDETDDGWGIEGVVFNANVHREASTRGHASPYTTKWQTGDLDEDQRLTFNACLVKGSEEVCTGYTHRVHA
ncbi:hypothetical protein SGFS_026190 [Streptomyces graminofaciens]|uniref:Secreted protein n=1 Tax=Streptomyces graminofaciens TaxID=68212 RepID=A0ABM7F6K7_9ACTN|nr:hypothetical protein [Streptomyces graminofaciens]BBC31325.1 hypothetical protein SGFS_026190 [Streptomyces graminofaciens]